MGSEKPWGAWTEEKLPFIAKRNREKYMLIGSRPDCWPFSFLGVDQLVKIDRKTFRLLYEKIVSFQELGILNTEAEQAA